MTQGDSRPIFTSCDGTQRQILLPHRYSEEAQEEIVSHLQKSDVMFGDLYGYSAGWKGSLFEVSWFERLEFSPDACNNDPDLQRMRLRAFGHEPSWNLRLIDKRMLLERAGKAPLDVPYVEDWRSNKSAPFRAEVNGQKIELRFTSDRCVDSTTGGIYAKKAQLRIGNDVLQGCAYDGESYD